LRTSSASGRISLIGREVFRTIQAIGFSSSLEVAWMIDSSTSSGRPCTVPSFSETSSRAMSLFTPQSNLSVTSDSPSLLVEVISCSPSTKLSCSSILSVTWSSTSSGAAPG
jgi:hypothetical protein